MTGLPFAHDSIIPVAFPGRHLRKDMGHAYLRKPSFCTTDL